MVDKVTLANVASFQNDTSAVSTVNNNMALITTAMDNTLSRDGTTPNTMSATLDMNSNQIINLPPPAGSTSPARLIDVVSNPSLLLTVPPTGTSGHTVPFLDTSCTWSGSTTQTFSGNVTLTLNPVFTTGALQFSNNTRVAVNSSLSTKQFSVRSGTSASSVNSVFHQGFQASYELMNNAGTVNHYFGIDDSDSNKLKIGPGYSPGQALTPYMTFIQATGFAAMNTASASTSDRLLIEDGTGAVQLRVRYTAKTGVQFQQTSAGNGFINVTDNNPLIFGTNNTVQATLFASGGFGVGNAAGDPGTNNISAIGRLLTFTATATPAGGSNPSLVMGTSATGIYWGSGAPTASAPQGSIYLRTDGSSTSTRLYVNTTGSTTWTNVTTAA